MHQEFFAKIDAVAAAARELRCVRAGVLPKLKGGLRANCGGNEAHRVPQSNALLGKALRRPPLRGGPAPRPKRRRCFWNFQTSKIRPLMLDLKHSKREKLFLLERTAIENRTSACTFNAKARCFALWDAPRLPLHREHATLAALERALACTPSKQVFIRRHARAELYRGQRGERGGRLRWWMQLFHACGLDGFDAQGQCGPRA